jgi:hypothetical protein
MWIRVLVTHASPTVSEADRDPQATNAERVSATLVIINGVPDSWVRVCFCWNVYGMQQVLWKAPRREKCVSLHENEMPQRQVHLCSSTCLEIMKISSKNAPNKFTNSVCLSGRLSACLMLQPENRLEDFLKILSSKLLLLYPYMIQFSLNFQNTGTLYKY